MDAYCRTLPRDAGAAYASGECHRFSQGDLLEKQESFYRWTNRKVESNDDSGYDDVDLMSRLHDIGGIEGKVFINLAEGLFRIG